MKLSKNDLGIVRKNLLIFCASTLTGGLVVYASMQHANHMQLEKHDALNLLADARNRLKNAQQDHANMDTYLEEYAALEERKIIGDDRRLDWIEGLEDIRRQNLVADFRYNIAPQKNYAISSGNFDTRYSEMRLQFDLLHEAQLPNFFEALRTQIKGWYQLEGCALHRTGSDSGQPVTARLAAECSGGWITLKNRNEPQ